MDKYNCSPIMHRELWFDLMVTCDSLAILSGAIAIVMVVYLKLYLKIMYRLELYQVLSAVLSSVMWMIYGFVIKLYKGDVCVPWVKIILYLAIFCALLQLCWAFSVAAYLYNLTIQAGRLAMRKTQCKCMLRSDLYIQEHKWIFEVILISLAIILCNIYSAILIFITNSDFGTFTSFYFLVYMVLFICILITIMILLTCSSLQSKK